MTTVNILDKWKNELCRVTNTIPTVLLIYSKWYDDKYNDHHNDADRNINTSQSTKHFVKYATRDYINSTIQTISRIIVHPNKNKIYAE